MSTLVDDAVELLMGLPEELQITVARAILDYGASCDDDLQLSDAQVKEIKRRIANPNPELISLRELDSRLRHCRE